MNSTPTKYFWKAADATDTQMLEIGTLLPQTHINRFELKLYRDIDSLERWSDLFAVAGSKIYDENGQRVTAGRMLDRINDCTIVNVFETR
jgi:hypothetical protein